MHREYSETQMIHLKSNLNQFKYQFHWKMILRKSLINNFLHKSNQLMQIQTQDKARALQGQTDRDQNPREISKDLRI